MKIFLLTAAGLLLLGLGVVGLFVPVWPTTPFVISSFALLGATPRIRGAIMTIPFFREYIEGYREKRPISAGTALSSLVFLWGMLLFSMLVTKKLWLIVMLSVIGAAVTIHILYMSGRGKSAGGDMPVTPGRDRGNRPIFRYFELIFDLLYLLLAAAAGVIILLGAEASAQRLAGIAALVLVFGDSFHLIPRMGAIMTGDEARFQISLGRGKLITSVTMTLFYVLLWHMGKALFDPENTLVWDIALYALAAGRIVLCLLPQNGWTLPEPPPKWGLWRNLPFVAMGLLVGLLFFINRAAVEAVRHMWLAIALSFAFYIPVFLRAHRCPALGMLMLPKSCMYLWILWMCTSI